MSNNLKHFLQKFLCYQNNDKEKGGVDCIQGKV